jgi:Flp pilus assembly protein TadB
VNLIITLVIPAMLGGLGLTVIVAALLPTQPSLSGAIERMGASSVPTDEGVQATMQDRVTGATIRRLHGTSLLKTPTADLNLIGMSVNRWVWQKILLAALGLVLPITIGLITSVLGLAPIYIPALLGLPLAFGAWFLPDIIVRDQAKDARLEFTRAVAVYYELIGSERARGASPSEALESAASVGKAWPFVRIRTVLTEARYSLMASWDALERLSTEIQVPELGDIARVIRISGEEGGSIYETLRARGQSLRDRLLNEEKKGSKSTTNGMIVLMALTGVLFLLILGTPALLDALL